MYTNFTKKAMIRTTLLRYLSEGKEIKTEIKKRRGFRLN